MLTLALKIGDTLYVRGNHGSGEDLERQHRLRERCIRSSNLEWQFWSTIFTPLVTLMCCPVNVQSHRAMIITRTLYYVSPPMVRRISAIGEKRF